MSRPGTPQISVIIPVLNGKSMIGSCVESILALEYPQEQIEVMVVDNGSSDGTREIVARHPVRLLAESSVRTSYAARTLGVREASGEILAFTDADCRVAPGWLSALVPHFDDKTVGGVSGGILPAQPLTPTERYASEHHWLSNKRAYAHAFRPGSLTANAAYRREVFERVGLFESSWPSGGDFDLAWRMQIDGGWRLVYEPEAKVYHHHRSTLAGLYRQRRRTATGSELLAAKWEHRGYRRRSRLLRNVVTLGLKALALPLSCVAAPVAPQFFWRTLAGLVARAADIAGRKQGRRLAEKLVGEEPVAAFIKRET